ncbi:catalase family protein [Leptospira idonii]|uniref:Catalase n=1 Tax=Leptospira idonii TaxID=1193500 RepID=A0A4R9M4H6_9LEPT|nr:catalase family protein [Leptospira idonii]TGN20881.1 catalase [Leptospira idonii]
MKQIHTLLFSVLFLALGCGGPYVKIPSTVELGKEYPFPDEENTTKRTLDLTLTSLKESYQGGALVRRDAHPKHHGCMAATFTVKKDLNPDYKLGLFVPGKSYTTLVRFSNGAQKPKADKEGDIRGVGLKLFDVPGKKLLAEESTSTTHDFLLINHPILPVGAPDEYLALFEAAFAGKPASYIFGWNPFGWKLGALSKVRDIRGKKISSPLEIRYWSTTPYAFGEGKAVKYSLKPCKDSRTEIPSDPKDNYLRETMEKQLKESSGCFTFMVQLQKDARSMPVEDPAVEWNESESPFYPVAELIIPKQEFANETMDTLCENVSYTPWHALPEHRPIGGINRVRKSVYEAISKYRHDTNKTPRKEIDKKNIPSKLLPSS